MDKPMLYRRRFIPDETVELKKDKLLFWDEEMIITKWDVLHPRNDFSYGYSCLYIKKGYKVSKFFTVDRQLLYTYCDIVENLYDCEKNTYTSQDLLIDVIIYENGFVKVADIAEISDALDKELITVEQAKFALRKTDDLLKIIYDGRLCELTCMLDKYIHDNPIQ